MSQGESFTVDKVGWHTRTPGNTETREKTNARFRAVIDFLQENELTTCVILRPGDPIDDETSIHTNALTAKGFCVIKECYQKWLKKVDRGMSPQDVSMFANALKTVDG